jgi:ankyrin repeat protein
MAAFHKSTSLAKLLVQKGAPLNLQDEDLNTPLIIAAHQGNKEMVALLLQAGADPALKDKWGTAVSDDFRLREQSPEIAAMIQSAAKAKAPADAGSSKEEKNTSVTTPRTQSGVDRLNEVLAEARKDESVADQRVKNAMLQNAARLGKVENVARYLKEGADINTLDPVGNTPLMLAAQRGHPETVKFLIEKGADVTKTNRFGKMAINLAKDPDVISVLKSSAGTK